MKLSIKLILIIALFAVSTAAHAQYATPQDRAFVAKVSQGGMFEVAAGHMAMSKGSTQDIIDFATAEVHDHMLVPNWSASRHNRVLLSSQSLMRNLQPN
jgi:predicted outer membrane protein